GRRRRRGHVPPARGVRPAEGAGLMAVYVDDAVWPARGRRWCHLVADGADELHAFAARLGLLRAWFQHRPARPWHDHYDVPEELRPQALALGAVALDRRAMAARLAALRRAARTPR